MCLASSCHGTPNPQHSAGRHEAEGFFFLASISVGSRYLKGIHNIGSTRLHIRPYPLARVRVDILAFKGYIRLVDTLREVDCINPQETAARHSTPPVNGGNVISIPEESVCHDISSTSCKHVIAHHVLMKVDPQATTTPSIFFYLAFNEDDGLFVRWLSIRALRFVLGTSLLAL